MARRATSPFLTLSDLEPAARRRSKSEVWEYIETGAGGDATRKANEAAFARWTLRPRVLQDVRSVELGTQLLSDRVSVPFFAAPTAYHGAVTRAGEVATARALARYGILGVYSTLSSRSVEEIGTASGGAPHWFQLYLQPEFDRSLELVRRAERSGFTALVVTVDAPILGPRDLQARKGFAIVGERPLGNGPYVRTPERAVVRRGGQRLLAGAPRYSWKVVDRLRRSTSLPLVVKGVLTAEDARAAAAHGASAVVVSNHGGRQLDRTPPTLEVLPEIVRAVGRRVEVYLDGGVRRASEILIARALGARATGIGRPILWALAAGGERGLERWAELLTSELAISMILLGRRRVADVDRSAVRPSLGWADAPLGRSAGASGTGRTSARR